ncbi:zinc finger protein 675-like [Episyrphus balteatus]|uniref:zinc finger protein 675-like n=1 Tax=Episyrphus balteatus TaxID=286459 RepID=UPI0024866EC8|nr:zinc finger protein 675-like [Episyrphus balteatus]
MECIIKEKESPELNTILQVTTENENTNEFICFQCFKDFETQGVMLEHIEIEHFTFICDKCNKHFPTEKRLKKHLRDAHLSGKFPCPICNKIFTRKDHCKDHVYTHSEKPLFRCKFENCDKIFRQSINLKQHEKIHTGNYRKQCPLCNESVVQLSKHLHTHLETKQHQCSHCDKSFTRRCYLTAHEKIHLGEAGFFCKDCEMEFKSSNALYKHTRSKHNAEKYICEVPGCDQEFNRKDNMQSHMKRKH